MPEPRLWNPLMESDGDIFYRAVLLQGSRALILVNPTRELRSWPLLLSKDRVFNCDYHLHLSPGICVRVISKGPSNLFLYASPASRRPVFRVVLDQRR